MTALDDHTVAVSPRAAAAVKGEDGKPVAYVRLALAFGADGRLAERRLVLMPKDETLARETYAQRAFFPFGGEMAPLDRPWDERPWSDNRAEEGAQQ